MLLRVPTPPFSTLPYPLLLLASLCASRLGAAPPPHLPHSRSLAAQASALGVAAAVDEGSAGADELLRAAAAAANLSLDGSAAGRKRGKGRGRRSASALQVWPRRNRLRTAPQPPYNHLGTTLEPPRNHLVTAS